jgi:hypothetical protein
MATTILLHCYKGEQTKAVKVELEVRSERGEILAPGNFIQFEIKL